jgi:tetratricopeptide (TPR) repeat protein
MRVLTTWIAAASTWLATAAPAQRLGTLTFETSGAGEAQAHFIKGVLYLHSFEYPSALREFREAERLAPAFAMAYWGDAMTWTHPVWDQQQADSARAVLRRLATTPNERAARAPTPREKAYLHAVEVLYGTGTKAARDTAYSRAMDDLARRHPTDDEAQLFFALSLLGLNQGDRDIPTYQRAGAIAERVFARQPNHPGAAHYVIHAYDDPAHAQQGLAAARAYSKIAPDAAHAQHMTSHIFLALGLWDDVVAANETAVNVVNEAAHHAGHTARGCGHYPEWLEYAYLQQGRRRDAARVLDNCLARPATEGSTDDIESAAGMRAAYIVDSREWTGKFIAEPNGREPYTRAYVAFGTGYAAVMRRDTTAAERALDAMQRAAAQMRGDGSIYVHILDVELRGLVEAMRGDSVRALASIRDAARLDDSLPIPFGPPLTVKPPHEILGELLLGMRRYDESRAEFELALARTPRRPLALLGLSRAQTALGRSSDAAATMKTLADVWHAADDDLPNLTDVRRE